MRILKLRQVEVVILIYHQILVTNLQRNQLKQEGRISNQILGVKGLYDKLNYTCTLRGSQLYFYWETDGLLTSPLTPFFCLIILKRKREILRCHGFVKKIYHSIHQNVVKSINDTLNCASCTICFFCLTHLDTISVQSTCTCITQQTQDNMKSDLPHT